MPPNWDREPTKSPVKRWKNPPPRCSGDPPFGFPSAYEGQYFFLDLCGGWIYALDPDQIDPAVRERIRAMVAHSLPLSRLAPDFQELDPPAVGRLAEIQAPTLIVLGDKDTPDILAIGKLLHEQVAGSELAMLRDVGHTLVMEQPAEFNALVDRFLSE